jgi:hypothetical protein
MYKAVWKCEKKVNGQEAAYWNAVLGWPGWGILLDDLYGPKFAATAYIHNVISGHTKWAICLQDMFAVPLFRDKSWKCDMSWVSLRKNPEFPFLLSSCSWMLLGSPLSCSSLWAELLFCILTWCHVWSSCSCLPCGIIHVFSSLLSCCPWVLCGSP